MKIHAVAGMALILFLASPAGAADAPHTLGGFVLGETIDRYTDRLKMDTVVKVRDTGCLMEVDVIPPEGFVNGSITYGVCVARNRIVRIKFKYEDDSAAFLRKAPVALQAAVRGAGRVERGSVSRRGCVEMVLQGSGQQ